MSLPWRRVLFGRPLATHQSHEHKLPKFLALPIFASDAISSVAYATEEILLALTLGTGIVASVALRSVLPISASVAILLAVVVFSYRHRRARAAADPARFCLRLRGDDRHRGDLQRRAGLPPPGIAQRLDHAHLDGRHPRQPLPRDQLPRLEVRRASPPGALRDGDLH